MFEISLQYGVWRSKMDMIYMMYNIHDSAVHVGNVEAHGGAEVGKHEQVERRAGVEIYEL